MDKSFPLVFGVAAVAGIAAGAWSGSRNTGPVEEGLADGSEFGYKFPEDSKMGEKSQEGKGAEESKGNNGGGKEKKK